MDQWDAWHKDLSLRILRWLLEFGLLLQPEEKSLRMTLDPDNRADGGQNDGYAFVPREPGAHDFTQCRCCFTLSDIKSLQKPYPGLNMSHRQLFGEIAIGLELRASQTFGIHPCGYFHDDVDLSGSESLTDSSAERGVDSIISQANQIRDVLKILSIVESVSRTLRPKADQLKILTIDRLTKEVSKLRCLDDSAGAALITKLVKMSPKSASDVIDCTDIYRESMFELLGKFDLMLSLYQNVSARSRRVPLHYYDQQEWRLIRTITRSIVMTCLDVSVDPYGIRDSAETRETNRAMRGLEQILQFRHSRPIHVQNPQDYWLLWGLGAGKDKKARLVPFCNFIKVIICPLTWKPSVSACVNEINRNVHFNHMSHVRVVSWEDSW